MRVVFTYIFYIFFCSFLFSECLDDGCQIQIINNTQSLVLDIYIGGNLSTSSLEHRAATDMFLLPVAGNYIVGIAIHGQEVSSEFLFEYLEDQEYRLVITGSNVNSDYPIDLTIIPTQFICTPNDYGVCSDYTLNIFNGYTESSSLNIYDSNNLINDFYIDQNGLVVNELEYGEFENYLGFIQFDDIVIRVSNPDANIFIDSHLDLSEFAGKSVLLFTSNFPDNPNAPLGLFAVLNSGSVIELDRYTTNTLRVPESFSTIQEAINYSSDGDTVLVSPGIYYENVVLNKSIILSSYAIFDNLTDWVVYDDYITSEWIVNNNNIQQTMLVGSNPEDEDQGSVILITPTDDVCIYPEVFGFTLRDGSGTKVLKSGDSVFIGGGILADVSNPKIHFNQLISNGTDNLYSGGGIYLTTEPSDWGFDNRLDDYTPDCSINNYQISNNYYDSNQAIIGKTIANSMHYGDFNMIGSVFDILNCSVDDTDALSSLWVKVEPEADISLDNSEGNACTNYLSDIYINPNIETECYGPNCGLEDFPYKTLSTVLERIIPTQFEPVEIYLSSGIYSPLSGENFPLTLQNYTNIYGYQMDSTIIDAQMSETVFLIENVDTLAISDLTIMGGNPSNNGGGILMKNASPNLTNVVIKQNYATYGAGMYLFGSSPILSYVTIVDNHSLESGGGIRLHNSNPILDHITISGNTSRFGGAGMYLTHSSPRIENSIIWGNHLIDHPNPDGDPLFNIYISDDLVPEYSWNNIQDNWQGVGHIQVDPLFCDSQGGDYHLASNSPCVNWSSGGDYIGSLGVGCTQGIPDPYYSSSCPDGQSVDCWGICGGSAFEDCSGYCMGNNSLDSCGVCSGQNEDMNSCGMCFSSDELCELNCDGNRSICNEETGWSFDFSTNQSFKIFENFYIDGEAIVGDGTSANDYDECYNNPGTCDVLGSFIERDEFEFGEDLNGDGLMSSSVEICVGWTWGAVDGWHTMPIMGAEPDWEDYTTGYLNPGEIPIIKAYDASRDKIYKLDIETIYYVEYLGDCNDDFSICWDDDDWDDSMGNGVWDEGEEFQDVNENDVWDGIVTGQLLGHQNMNVILYQGIGLLYEDIIYGCTDPDACNYSLDANANDNSCIYEDYEFSCDEDEGDDLGNEAIMPTEYSLDYPYPNPFNPVTNINFSVPQHSKIKISIYDVMGRLVTILSDHLYTPGHHSISWDGSPHASGVYFVRMQGSSFMQTQKVMLIK